MAKPRIQDVLESIRDAITAALNAAISAGNLASTPAQVVVGWPASTELVNIINQSEYQVSVFLLPGGKMIMDEAPQTFPVPGQSVPLMAAVSGNAITFSGSVVAGLNVHAFVGAPLSDAYYQTLSGDSLASVATAVKNRIITLSLPGISASVSGDVTTVTGSPYVSCNVGLSTVALQRECVYLQKSVQVSVWCSNPMVRYAVVEPILESIGTTDNSFLTLSDGMAMRIQNSGRGNWYNDKMQSAYSTYVEHIIFDVEFFVTKSLSGAQVESLEEETSINNATAENLIGDGVVTY